MQRIKDLAELKDRLREVKEPAPEDLDRIKQGLQALSSVQDYTDVKSTHLYAQLEDARQDITQKEAIITELRTQLEQEKLRVIEITKVHSAKAEDTQRKINQKEAAIAELSKQLGGRNHAA